MLDNIYMLTDIEPEQWQCHRDSFLMDSGGKMASFSCLRYGTCLQSRRTVDLSPPDVDKRNKKNNNILYRI